MISEKQQSNSTLNPKENVSEEKGVQKNKLVWKEVWKKIGRNSPSRREVFPSEEDANMPDDEIVNTLNAFLKEGNLEYDNYSGIDGEEFPEMIDVDIRKVCMALNKLPFLKTREGCGGHEYFRSTGEIFKAGFSEPYLVFLAVKNDPGTDSFLQKLKEKFEEFKKADIPGIKNVSLNSYSEDSELNSIGLHRYNMVIAPTKEWCRKNNKKYIDFPQQLGFFSDWCEKNGYVYSDEEESEARVKWEEAKNKLHEEMKNFNEEYFDYFRSEEVRKLRDEFFKVFDQARILVENENERELLTLDKNIEQENQEENLVDEAYPEEDPRRWLKLVESEYKSTIEQYYNNLGLSDKMLSRKESILDIGASMADFAAHCKASGVSDRVISLEPKLDSVSIERAAQRMVIGEELYRYIQSKTVAGVMEQLPFKNAAFDLIVVHAAMPGFKYSLNEVEKMEKGVDDVFDEIVRVLKPGGEARLFALADGTDERWSKWRAAVDKKLKEIEKVGKCSVFVEDIIDLETGNVSTDKRLVLKKKIEQENVWPSEEELFGYVEKLKKGDENFERFEKFEIKKLNELLAWKEMRSFFESKNFKGLEDLKVIVIDDENFWKNFYGSNDSKSSYNPKTIILKKNIFEKEGISTEEVSLLVHEVAHLLFYDSLGGDLEKYMEEYYSKGVYTDSVMEKSAFEMQFEFLKFKGKTKQQCVDEVKKYLDEVFEDDEEGKTKEFEQLMKYVESVY